MSAVLRNRVEKITKFYQNICSEELEDILVTDYEGEDGKREYQSLWLFSHNYIIEAQEFIEKDDFDLGRMQPVRYLRIEMKDFTPDEESDTARISIRVSMENSIGAEIKGTGCNANRVWAILAKFFLQNFSSLNKTNDHDSAANKK